MKKSNFVAMILGTIGGILSAIGICMTLVTEWNALQPGIVIGGIGFLTLAIMVFTYRKMEHKTPIKISGKVVLTSLVAIVGAILLGIGMVFTMVWSNMFQGIIIGIMGIVVLIALIPMTKGVNFN